ncbi:CHAT domain-containing protein [Suillus cothurnatus]|nr:CHAT domain-containing protein [Suillus cothurnatus]
MVESEIARETDAGHERFATYVTSKTVSHLNDAIQHFQLVLDQCPVGHPDRAGALTNLAWARLEGYTQNDLQDIDSVTSLFREALALCPQGHPDHPLYLYHLTSALNWRYAKENFIAAYIHESAQLYCKLLPLCPEGTYLDSIAAGANGVNYVIRECDKLPIDTSDEGIHIRRVILELCPLGNEHHPKALDKLGWALRSHFEQCGSIDDLDESIQRGREAVSLSSEGHSERYAYVSNLAHSLWTRFNHQGNYHDLDEAISLCGEALRLCPVGHQYRDFTLDNLGNALFTRFKQCSDVNNINRAISLQREALTLRPPGHPYRDCTLNNLANSLQSRYDKLDVSEDLDEAIDLYRDSLQLMPHGHPFRHQTLYNLSSALSSRFTRTQKSEDIEEAIRLCQESLAHPTQGYLERILEAIEWVRESELCQHVSALEAYQTCLDLFNNHVMMRSSIISRREAATAFYGARSLPVDAASCAIRRDDLRRAVELLEQGRGQQWLLSSRFKTPIEDLESENSNLAHRLSELSKCLSEAQGSTVSTDRAAAERAETQYRRLQAQWETVVAEIRNIKGFSRFLLPPSYEDLQAAARHGPVIILLASQYSCGAIIVPTSGEPLHVPLPSIALTDLTTLKDRFARAIRQSCRMKPGESRKDLIVLLRTVWEAIMLPIVNVLEHVLELKHQSRIWLCPTAAFTSIPLHAAHPFQTRPDRSKEPCLEDLYICSYTPTLSALVRSRKMMKKRVRPSFVAIGQGQPRAGKSKELLAVDSKIELVRKLVPETINHTTISGLEENTWVHLACHGKQDCEQPYNSHFVMKDQPITLLDIMEKDIPHAEFAFLSACHTAVGNEETPDEVIHLAAGLQFSGFKSVIGTLWEVDDAVAKHVVKAFYENLFKDLEVGGEMDCMKAAWALNRATHSVKTKVLLEQRMVFIHVGV